MNQLEIKQSQTPEDLRQQIKTVVELTPIVPNINIERDLETVGTTIASLECPRLSYEQRALVPADDALFQSDYIPVTIVLDERPLFTIHIAASLPLNGREPENAQYAFDQTEFLELILRKLQSL